MANKLIGQAQAIAKDLLYLEVNVIASEAITGGKMPAPQIALREIALLYTNWYFRDLLHEDQNDLERQVWDIIDLGNQLNIAPCRNVYYEIERLADKQILSFHNRLKQTGLNPEEENLLGILYRISDATSQIIRILEMRFPIIDPQGQTPNPARPGSRWINRIFSRSDKAEEKTSRDEFSPDDIISIRKIWEIGLDEIAMQTTIQLDGDVVTRINPKYAIKDYEILHKIYNQSVEIMLDYWDNLIDVLMDFLSNIVQRRLL